MIPASEQEPIRKANVLAPLLRGQFLGEETPQSLWDGILGDSSHPRNTARAVTSRSHPWDGHHSQVGWLYLDISKLENS